MRSLDSSSPPRRILGLCGSLRARSFNLWALKAAAALMPARHVLEIAPLSGIPVYDADEQATGWPPCVLALAQAVRDSDGVLIASPEYNFSIPGGLKNVIDWLSRVPDQPFKARHVAIMGAATGPLGTARMQYELRKVLQSLEADVLAKPEVFIGMAASKFDEQGRLVDEATRGFVERLLEGLAVRIDRSSRR
jgi:chromate reductase